MIAIPPSVVADARAAASDVKVQAAIVAIAYYESGWNPGAIGDYTVDCQHFYPASSAPAGSWPTSFGYLQMHNNAGGCPSGLGNGYSQQQLLDGVFNFELGARDIAAALAAGSSMYDAMQPWSTRPSAYPFWQQIVASGVLDVHGTLVCTTDADCVALLGPGYVCQNGSCVAAGGGLQLDGTTLLLLALALLVADGDL